MKERKSLLQRLIEYSDSDTYPFHMPGHKRRRYFPNPFAIDITEVEGFDNLHHAEGILKESMNWAAKIYGCDRTYYLVNGSSCGILSAICGSTKVGGTVLMGRNCHKSAYHAVFLNHLNVIYSYPQNVCKYGVQGGLLPTDIDFLLKRNPDIQAVVLVSPTYDGIISDIEGIARVVHSYEIPLIIDEAHGAHLFWGDDFPESALTLGADIVIQSVHKTLPSLTQTALMHIREGLVDTEKIEHYLQIFQSSSPSYVFMASIEHCIMEMVHYGSQNMKTFYKDLMNTRDCLKSLCHLKLMDESIVGQCGVYTIDNSKLVISTRDTCLKTVNRKQAKKFDGYLLAKCLQEKYHLEVELIGADYVVALTTLADTKEGLERLKQALLEIDSQLEMEMKTEDEKLDGLWEYDRSHWRPEIRVTIFEASSGEVQRVLLKESEGRIAAEFIYLYPPGIPIIAPGELIQREALDQIMQYLRMNLPVQGLKDVRLEYIEVIKERLTKG